MTVYKSVTPCRGLLATFLPLADVPAGRGWRMFSGTATHNHWLKLPPNASKRAKAAFAKHTT